MTAAPSITEQIRRAAAAAADKKAENLVALDVSDQMALTDAFLICSGTNERQVDAIVDSIEDAMGGKPYHREGHKSGRWVLLDFIDFVVHVQHTEERAFYDLERLWKDCPRIQLDGDDA